MKLLLLAAFLGLALALPTNFDARQQWTSCTWDILNQESCGSCWDFCSMESFANRLCITGEAPKGTIISPEPVLDCSGQGCDGGWPSTAWNWVITNGNSVCTSQCFSGCLPYDSGAGKSPSCHKGTCDSGSKWPTTYYGGSFSSLSGLRNHDLTLYQTELYNNGPLQACFTVYSNFYTFFDTHPKGIYTSSSGSNVGGHCVKMIGWGVENGQDYWLFANSWDTTWADGGYFKMARGTNLCGIEGQVSEGMTPKQAKAAGFFGIHPNINNTQESIVGGWRQQEDVDADPIFRDAAVAGLKLVGANLHRDFELKEIESVTTQVVAGLNFKLVVSTVSGERMYMRLFRQVSGEYVLVEHNLVF